MRLLLLVTSAILALGGGLPTQARPPLVVVLSGAAVPYQEAAAGLRQGMQRSGMPVATVTLDAAGDLKGGLPADARAVVAIGTRAAQRLVGLLPADTPLAYCLVADPAAIGLDQRRFTSGVGISIPVAAQVGLLRQALPDCRRIGVMYRAADESSRQFVAEVRAALGRGMQLEKVPIDRHGNPAEAIEALLGARVDAILTQPDGAIYDHACIRNLLLKSLRGRVPVFGFSSSFVRAGALIGVGIDASEQGQQAADIALELLAAPDDEPPARVQVPRYRVYANLHVAERLDIRLPQAVLDRLHRDTEEDK